MKRAALHITAVALAHASMARADRYEAAVSVQAGGAAGAIPNTGATTATVAGGGGTIGIGWGVRDWLDVSGEVDGWAFAQARYTNATERIEGAPETGQLTRTTRLVHARAGATLRLGVTWVPSIYAGIGAGVRLLTDGVFTPEHSNESFTADGQSAKTKLDLLTTVRLGLDHRIGPRWSIGVAVEGTHVFGLGQADLNTLGLSVRVAYRWYPLW